MAIYEFKCPKCLVITRESHPMSSKVDKAKCWKCGQFSAERMISPSNFRIKGYSEKNGYSKRNK
jgi:putative FmdB family regulatory protein